MLAWELLSLASFSTNIWALNELPIVSTPAQNQCTFTSLETNKQETNQNPRDINRSNRKNKTKKVKNLNILETIENHKGGKLFTSQ